MSLAFSDALRAFRTEAGLSQKALSHKANMDHSFVCRLEQGKRMPSRDTVEQISHALGLTEMQSEYMHNQAGFTLGEVKISLEDVAALALKDSGYSDTVIAYVDSIWRSTLKLVTLDNTETVSRPA